jgi:hypothetical protein
MSHFIINNPLGTLVHFVVVRVETMSLNCRHQAAY